MRVKLAWLVRVGGARPTPFTTITITSKVAVYAPAEWADTLTLFHLYQYMNSVVLAHTLCCTLYTMQLFIASKGLQNTVHILLSPEH